MKWKERRLRAIQAHDKNGIRPRFYTSATFRLKGALLSHVHQTHRLQQQGRVKWRLIVILF